MFVRQIMHEYGRNGQRTLDIYQRKLSLTRRQERSQLSIDSCAVAFEPQFFTTRPFSLMICLCWTGISMRKLFFFLSALFCDNVTHSKPQSCYTLVPRYSFWAEHQCAMHQSDSMRFFVVGTCSVEHVWMLVNTMQHSSIVRYVAKCLSILVHYLKFKALLFCGFGGVGALVVQALHSEFYWLLCRLDAASYCYT